VIQRRLENFWGYGSLDAPAWFVGMEEGLSSKDELELTLRLNATDRKVTVDIRRDMLECSGHMRWFRPPYPVQNTWRSPIALYLALTTGRIPEADEIQEHQRLVLGDIQLKKTTAIELMPLPSNKAEESAWLYSQYSVLGLSTRKEYVYRYKASRVSHLAKLIQDHRPKLFVFYSMKFLDDWCSAASVPLSEINQQMYFGQDRTTSFCAIPHSVAVGMSYARLYAFADGIRARAAKLVL
jgi:hypothetical protein